MIGRVFAVNRARGMVALATEDGYTIIEMLGDDPPDIGDEMCWAEDLPLGDEWVRNLTERSRLEVYFQDHHVSRGNLRRALLIS